MLALIWTVLMMALSGFINLDIDDAELAERELCEARLRNYVKFAWDEVEPATPFKSNWHIDAVCDHLEAVSDGEIRRLIIMMPPRHMKSLCMSVFWPSWDWGPGGRPDRRWLFSSYAEKLSIRDSIKTRRLIQRPWYQRHWGRNFSLTKDQNAKIRFDNNRAGYRLATSVEGSNTGEGGDIIGIDDAHNAVEAESEAKREAVCDWWDGTMSTRLNDPRTGAVVICMQRLHEYDLVGHVLEKQKKYSASVLKELGWEVLCLPARYESNHPTISHTSLGFVDPRDKSQGGPGDGALLWPKRMGQQELAALEYDLTPRRAAGQLQQRPSPAGGGIFKREYFRYFKNEEKWYTCLETGRRVLKQHCWRFMVADTAMTEKSMADWTVRFVFDVERVVSTAGNYVPGDMFLVDVFRAQLSCPKVEAQFRSDIERFNPLFLCLEDINDGRVIFQRFRLDNLPVRPMKYGDSARIPDKVTKAIAAEVAMAQHRVRFEHNAPYLDALEKELLLFPNGGNDDQVDTLTMGCHVTQGRDFWVEQDPPPSKEGTMGQIAGHREVLSEPKRQLKNPFKRTGRS